MDLLTTAKATPMAASCKNRLILSKLHLQKSSRNLFFKENRSNLLDPLSWRSKHRRLYTPSGHDNSNELNNKDKYFSGESMRFRYLRVTNEMHS